ncbi:putative chromosome 2-partitioning protein ParB [Deinococcus piscis]|uniref:Chromosome 2-partitioning protein ParB n=1 Tax=Deinococcus piscis TaxID=394230 RepID=A0ABQ3KDY2_9DEIO|nr:ParB/RepB/Spo0J family partition protein [Deinococcus piscis]GHG10480.1 putative chromosome 2-partitioning protein ParB [Deinococcus piscis]
MTRNSALAAARARAQQATDSIRESERRNRPVRYIPLEQIEPSPYQARRDFQAIDELAADIQANGVLQPVVVRQLGEQQFQLVAGERRLRASQVAGETTIPAMIHELTDRQARIYGLQENLQREDLNAYEVARAVLDLTALELGRDAEEVQKELGANHPPEETLRVLSGALGLVNKELTYQSYKRNYLALLRLPQALVTAIEQGASYSAVLALRAATPEQQRDWLPKVVSGEWSRRQVQQAIREAKSSQAGRGEQKPDLVRQWSHLSGRVDPERLMALDTRKQEKASRLLAELAKLVEEN